MPKQPIKLNSKFKFQSKTDANKFFSGILKSSKLKTPLKNKNFSAVKALLLNHPDSDEKIGTGIDTLYADADTYGYRCFHVKRTDGSVESFSIKRCLNGEPSDFVQFSRAARNTVGQEIYDKKVEFFKKNQNYNKEIQCPDTQEWISLNEAHVDHRIPSFSVICKTFIVNKEMVDEKFLSKIEFVTDGVYGSWFKNKKLSDEFALYHRKSAVLRIIKAKENLRKASEARVTPTKYDFTLH